MENMICNRREEVEQSLTQYINRPVYVKGYCWNKSFKAILRKEKYDKRSKIKNTT